ncbi:MAG: HD domain-containing protein, partial [Bacteroidia bacterium]|nr:HD domain-containing protein [Bacteroidia bacterium]
MNNKLIEETQEYVRQYFMANVGEEFSYHNFDHTISVAAAAESLAKEAGLRDEECEMLVLAALFHDTGFGENPSNHEFHSEKIGREYLEALEYPEEKIDIISQCILATKMDWKGNNKMCHLIRDADLSNLAASKYELIAERLRKERNATQNVQLNKEEWIKENILFIQNHYYCTVEGRRLFDQGKKENLKKLKKLDLKKKAKKPKLLTIGSSKSAQTQLKTALRNHIDLSAIADNKANIMLSVNAIVITVGLPILIDRSYT